MLLVNLHQDVLYQNNKIMEFMIKILYQIYKKDLYGKE